MTRERLPEELRDRLDLMEVAGEFHQGEVLAWLLRYATIPERELFSVLALERKLADSLMVAFENGFRPWWYRTREMSLKWRPSVKLEFTSPPDGFSVRGGWLTFKKGGDSALPALDKGGSRVWTLPRSVDRRDLMCAVLPAGVTAMGVSACEAVPV
jgi:hypothetical protein